MTDSVELELCPFCSGKAATPWPGGWKFNLTRTMFTGCFNHDVHPAFTMPVEAWNTRTASQGEVAELVEVLCEARLQLIYIDERSPSGTTPAVVTRIDAALSKYKGDGQ